MAVRTWSNVMARCGLLAAYVSIVWGPHGGVARAFAAESLAAPAPTIVPVPDPANDPARAAADRSLSVAGYLALGLPDPAKHWTVQETQKAMTVLRDLAFRDPSLLPRLENPESGRVFARLLAPEVGGELPSSVTPVAAQDSGPLVQFHLQSAYAQTLGGLARLYTPERKELGGAFDAEVVAAVCGSLTRTVRLLDLLEAARAAGPREVSTAEWLRLHEQVTYGAALMLRGAVFVYSARTALRPREQQRLETALVANIKPLLGHLPASVQENMRKQIDGMLGEEPSDARRAEWREISRAVAFASPAKDLHAKRGRGRR